MAGITLNWNPPTTNEDGTPVSNTLIYTVYENGEAIIADLAPAQFSIDMTGRPTGTYSYQVTARYEGQGESKKSDAVSVPFVSPPASPTELSFTWD